VILYYGSFLPLHGFDIVILAASLLRDNHNVKFKIIGDGPTKKKTQDLARKMKLSNMEFAPSIPYNNLPVEISRATICLGGHFSNIEKAKRVIPGKTYQAIAMGKATIVGDNPANRELLTHGKDAWFCRMNDPNALAEAINILINDAHLRESIGSEARQTFLRRASWGILSQQLKGIIDNML
jgi:glycosyltransferase involved in cell wall biosynthesis